MPSKKQRRRREKSRRHEYEYVLLDEEGNEIPLEGGSTLILDDYGRLKYEVHNRLPDPANQSDVDKAQARLQSLWEQGYFDEGASFAARLATIHRLRAGEALEPRAEVW